MQQLSVTYTVKLLKQDCDCVLVCINTGFAHKKKKNPTACAHLRMCMYVHFWCTQGSDLLIGINNWPKITLLLREHSVSSLYPWSIFIIQCGIQWRPNLQQPRILNYIWRSRVVRTSYPHYKYDHERLFKVTLEILTEPLIYLSKTSGMELMKSTNY